ncbi:hypothetical protein K1T71_011771 [Dendrolimus kikuchii]|uniref:Uncharacterized protein n=1 Tax=Dendrolimus kikuchii TaxID=765133 RepID=A0ACC1CMC8_9NEOP|nr:hypothetical protein K1T71_011771 [Dendrolimus kikuchii]
MVKFFTQFYPKTPFMGLNGLCFKTNLGHLTIKPNVRPYAKETDKSKLPGKEDLVTLKMPGFVHPENIHEEGYFTQKAKKELEELKKKLEKPSLDNPEKKDF